MQHDPALRDVSPTHPAGPGDRGRHVVPRPAHAEDLVKRRQAMQAAGPAVSLGMLGRTGDYLNAR